MTTTKGSRTNVYGTYQIGAQSYGSHRWFAVRDGQSVEPFNAAWFALSAARVEALRAEGIHFDGLARFFQTKRELVAAIDGN